MHIKVFSRWNYLLGILCFGYLCASAIFVLRLSLCFGYRVAQERRTGTSHRNVARERGFLTRNSRIFLITLSSIILLMFVPLAKPQDNSTVSGAEQPPASPLNESAGPPVAQPVTQPAEGMSWLEFLVKGGLTMIPIAFCSIGLIAILAVKFPLFRLMRFKVNSFSEALIEDISSGHIDRAISRCERTNNAITRPLRRGLDIYKTNQHRTADTLREAMLDEIPGLESYIGWLGVIAGVSPLLGLYGTVVGVIQAFIVLAAGGVVTDPNSFKVLADAIYKALITTAAGLFVGIPAFVAYEYLRMKISDMVRDMDRISVSLLNALGISLGGQS